LSARATATTVVPVPPFDDQQQMSTDPPERVEAGCGEEVKAAERRATGAGDHTARSMSPYARGVTVDKGLLMKRSGNG
jgi:hypothetical protein